MEIQLTQEQADDLNSLPKLSDYEINALIRKYSDLLENTSYKEENNISSCVNLTCKQNLHVLLKIDEYQKNKKSNI